MREGRLLTYYRLNVVCRSILLRAVRLDDSPLALLRRNDPEASAHGRLNSAATPGLSGSGKSPSGANCVKAWALKSACCC